jgi:para-nitrobenzyl esterase
LYAASGASDDALPIVETRQGKLRGRVERGTCVFKGIRYARVEGRLRPPVAPLAWSGVRDAFEFGPRAWQIDAGAVREPSGIAREMSEQCQVLNVWTPALDRGKRPVMVWLHGGGFTSGSASRPEVEGAELSSAHDVVVVTLNHRLGAFGYLYLGDAVDAAYGNTSLAGTMDMIAALQWVRDNIAAFGGDPGNVTIFGVSGGGGKVMTLLAMPAAAGLVHRGIVQSGTLDRNAAPPAEGRRFAEALLAEIGAPADRMTALLEVPAKQLLAAQAKVQQRSGFSEGRATFRRPFSPVIDGVDLPQEPFFPEAPPVSSNVPLMVGTCRAETRTFHRGSPENYSLTAAQLREKLLPILGDRTDEGIRLYSKTRPGASPSDLFFALSTAQMYWAGLVRTAESKARQAASAPGAAPVFVYEYAYDSGQHIAGTKIPLGAAHSSEVPLVFNHPRPPAGRSEPTEENVRVAAQISGMWAAFARTGSPNAAGLPRWTPYSERDRAVMRLDAHSTLMHDPDPIERRWWQEHGQVKV